MKAAFDSGVGQVTGEAVPNAAGMDYLATQA